MLGIIFSLTVVHHDIYCCFCLLFLEAKTYDLSRSRLVIMNKVNFVPSFWHFFPVCVTDTFIEQPFFCSSLLLKIKLWKFSKITASSNKQWYLVVIKITNALVNNWKEIAIVSIASPSLCCPLAYYPQCLHSKLTHFGSAFYYLIAYREMCVPASVYFND